MDGKGKDKVEVEKGKGEAGEKGGAGG